MRVFGAQRAGEAAKAGARRDKALARLVKVGRARLLLPSKQRSRPDTGLDRLAGGAPGIAAPTSVTDDERHDRLRVCGWGLAPIRSPFVAAYTPEFVIPSFETPRPMGRGVSKDGMTRTGPPAQRPRRPPAGDTGGASP